MEFPVSGYGSYSLRYLVRFTVNSGTQPAHLEWSAGIVNNKKIMWESFSDTSVFVLVFERFTFNSFDLVTVRYDSCTVRTYRFAALSFRTVLPLSHYPDR
jgi:hypothetical protein